MTDVNPIKHNWRFIDLTGQRFGRLIAIENTPPQYTSATGRGATMWRCQCDCSTILIVSYSNLKNGKQVSCGCQRRDNGRAKRTHGMKDTPEYQSWQHAKKRCFNPKDKAFGEYGGRGITMCDEWVKSFEAFFTHIGHRPPGLTLDRYPNNNGNYEPGNVRWATAIEQANNRRPRRWKVRPKA